MVEKGKSGKKGKETKGAETLRVVFVDPQTGRVSNYEDSVVHLQPGQARLVRPRLEVIALTKIDPFVMQNGLDRLLRRCQMANYPHLVRLELLDEPLNNAEGRPLLAAFNHQPETNRSVIRVSMTNLILETTAGLQEKRYLLTSGALQPTLIIETNKAIGTIFFELGHGQPSQEADQGGKSRSRQEAQAFGQTLGELIVEGRQSPAFITMIEPLVARSQPARPFIAPPHRGIRRPV